MQKITITIDKAGKTSIEVNGVKGSSCKDLTAEIEKALGIVRDSKLSSEYNIKPDVAKIKGKLT